MLVFCCNLAGVNFFLNLIFYFWIMWCCSAGAIDDHRCCITNGVWFDRRYLWVLDFVEEFRIFGVFHL
ncbi:hypothetical protein L6452_18385 [Arctium lappa]|uniref:Uncharacterized protein n=1 Tax=Arctium lappa TaxID=4217 RepID=A0ACB9C5X9_ARCLA|nr:hypothetical protein L6452_18385 [Arctium lappa]